jgi:purine-binding chemotaxis protein CheW
MKEKKKVKKAKKVKKVKKSKKSSPPAKKKAKSKAEGQAGKKKTSPAVKKKAAPKGLKAGKKGASRQGAKAPGADKKAPASKSGKPDETESIFIRGVPGQVGDEIVNEDGTVTFTHRDERARVTHDEEYLLFRFSGEGYSLKVTDVNEILKHQRITRVPGSAEHVIGAISMRGAIVPVVSLGSLLSIPDAAPPDNGRILILKGSGAALGILVEKRIGIMSFMNEDIKPHMAGMSGDGSAFVEGVLDVDGEFFTVLRPDAITRTKATGRLNETEA